MSAVDDILPAESEQPEGRAPTGAEEPQTGVWVRLGATRGAQQLTDLLVRSIKEVAEAATAKVEAMRRQQDALMEMAAQEAQRDG